MEKLKTYFSVPAQWQILGIVWNIFIIIILFDDLCKENKIKTKR